MKAIEQYTHLVLFIVLYKYFLKRQRLTSFVDDSALIIVFKYYRGAIERWFLVVIFVLHSFVLNSIRSSRNIRLFSTSCTKWTLNSSTLLRKKQIVSDIAEVYSGTNVVLCFERSVGSCVLHA